MIYEKKDNQEPKPTKGQVPVFVNMKNLPQSTDENVLEKLFVGKNLIPPFSIRVYFSNGNIHTTFVKKLILPLQR